MNGDERCGFSTGYISALMIEDLKRDLTSPLSPSDQAKAIRVVVEAISLLVDRDEWTALDAIADAWADAHAQTERTPA